MRKDITQTFLNACDLYIESVKIETQGYFYLVWKRGKKITQTLKYQSSKTTTFLKETLTLNIRTMLKNGRIQEKNTALYLLSADGTEIDQVSLPIQNWRSNFSTIEVPLGGGLLKAKVRLKQLMQVENCVHTNSDISEEQSQKDESKLLPWSRKNTNFIDGYKDEMQRIRKELQDNLYYNNKLKNDRNVLMSRNLQLETELNQLKRKIKEDWSNVHKHYKQKIQIREQIYEEQINSMVLTFNSNYEMNRAIMENLFADFESQKQTLMKVQNHNLNLNEQKQAYKEKINELQFENNELKKTIEEYKLVDEERMRLAKELEDTLGRLKQSEDLLALEQEKNYNSVEQIAELNFQMEQMKIQNEQCKGKIAMLEKFIEEEGQNTRNSQDLTILRIKQLEDQIALALSDLQATKNELQFTEAAWNKDREEAQKKEESYRQHIKVIEEELNSLKMIPVPQSKEKVDADLLAEYEEENKNLQQKVQNLEEENSLLKKEIDEKDKKELKRIKTESIEQREEIISELQDEIFNLKQEINALRIENEELKEELRNMKEREGIKVQQYQQLSEKVKQMESHLAEINENPQNIHSLLDDALKEDGSMMLTQKLNEQAKKLINEQQKIIIELKQEIKNLQVEKVEVVHEKKEIEEKLNLLTIQFAQKIGKKKKLENGNQVQIIEYFCDSEEEENKKLQEEQEKQRQEQIEDKFQFEDKDKVPIGNLFGFQPPKIEESSKFTSQEIETTEKKFHVKKATSMTVDKQQIVQKKPTPKLPTLGDEIEEDSVDRTSFHQKNEEKRSSQQSDQKPSSAFGFPIPIPPQPKQSSVKKVQAKTEEKRQQKRQSKHSIQSNSHSRSPSNRSRQERESAMSGNTKIRRIKISHTKQIQELRRMIDGLKSNEENLKDEIRQKESNITLLQLNIAETEKNYQEFQEKIQIEKENSKKEMMSSYIQAQVEKQNKGVIADIEDPEATKLIKQQQRQIEEHKKQYEKLLNEFNSTKKTFEYQIKMFEGKIAENEKRIQEFQNNYSDLKKQHEKLKRQSQQKERQAKDSYQDIKLQKAQVQFQMGTYQTDNKRLKNRVEELEEKVRKTDVLDTLRQVQFQSQTANKKVIELNRTLYQLRLEKQNIEDEIKIVRKKYNDQQRKVTEAEDLVDKLEKSIDDYKRKETRLRRDNEDKEDTVEKLRDQIKRLNDEIANMKSFYTQQNFERKKIMDDLTNLQHVSERKDYQIMNLKKQLEKMKQKLQEKEEERLDKKNNQKRQIQRLQEQLLRRDKEIIQYQSQIKHLTNKLQALQHENKKTMNSTSQSYSEKLKLYIDQITEIKKVIEDNNAQIASLKYKLNQMYEENEYIKNNYNKLQSKYEEQVANYDDLLQGYQNQKNQTEKLKDKNMKLEHEIENYKNIVKMLRTELENYKKQNELKAEKIEEILKNNEQNGDLINKFKVKLSDYETQASINKKLTEKLRLSQSRTDELNIELKGMKKKYEDYSRIYTITNEQYDKAVKETEMKWREHLDRTVEKLGTDLKSQANIKIKKLQGQLIEILNENSRLRNDLQKKAQFLSEVDHKNAKLQTLPIKIEELQNLVAQKQQQCQRYREYEKKCLEAHEKILKLQNDLGELSQKNKGINEETLLYKKDKKQLQIQSHNLYLKNREAQHNAQLLQRELEEAQKIQLELKAEISSLLAKVKGLEDEKDFHQNKLVQSKRQYDTKIQALEEKLELMSNTMAEHEKILEVHYEEIIEEVKGEIAKCYEEIEDKDKQIEEYISVINKLELEISDLKSQIQGYIEKGETDADLYEMEMNNIRNKLADNERAYISNISNLENQLSEMSKEMTALKMQKISSARRLKASEVEENAAERRLQEKVRVKDQKIEEMKNNIYILEETIVKLKRKDERHSQQFDELQALKKKNLEMEEELKSARLQLDRTKNKLEIVQTNLKNEVNLHKQREDALSLEMEQKLLELQSVKFELNSLKGLYSELQNELEKRKNTFKEKIDNETKLNEQLQRKNQYISEFQLKLEEKDDEIREKDAEIKKKTTQIMSLQTDREGLSQLQTRLKNKFNEKASIEENYKTEILKLTEQNSELKNENKKVKESNRKLERELTEVRRILSLNQSSIDSLNSTNEELSVKYKDMESVVRKYNELNDRAFHHYQMSLDEIFFQNYFGKKLKERQQEINGLIEEVEELKFLNDRKFMDYDDMKKENYELKLKLEDVEFTMDQVQELQQICDKLEQEKKDAIWREQMMRNQLDSFMNLEQSQFKIGNSRRKY